MKNKIIITLTLVACCLGMAAQLQDEKLMGNWAGLLTVPGVKLDMVFTFSAVNNKLQTKLEVPLQSPQAIPATRTVFNNDSLTVDFAMMRATYKGVYHADSVSIVGTWKQNGFSGELKLRRSNEKGSAVKHPQEPQKPYPYNEEEVTFENKEASVKLAGTFTWPKDKKKCPVVVLVSGSGPQDRDESLLGQKPFLVLADRLTRQGIAVLRYDDRGTAASTGNFKTATTFDFAADAEAAINYLKTRSEIDKKKIGMIGHSEGGLIAPIVASHTKVGFIVLLAGPGLKGSELIVKQAAAISAATGTSKEQIEKNAALNKKIYDLAVADQPGAADTITHLLKSMDVPAPEMQVKTLLSPWYRTFLATDPATYLAKVKCPVLALNGKKDLQVVYPDNLDAINTALAKNKNHEVKAYNDLNHLFQHCTTGAVEEYGRIEETMSEEVMSDIGNWILHLK